MLYYLRLLERRNPLSELLAIDEGRIVDECRYAGVWREMTVCDDHRAVSLIIIFAADHLVDGSVANRLSKAFHLNRPAFPILVSDNISAIVTARGRDLYMCEALTFQQCSDVVLKLEAVHSINLCGR